MSKKQKILIIVVIMISLVVGFFIGQKYGPIPDIVETRIVGQTFYATVENLIQKEDGIYITVQGLDINESKYRESFSFKVDNPFVSWGENQINILNLKKGTNISITFDGTVIKATDTNPAQINGIMQIRELDDELG